MSEPAAIDELLSIMATLRSERGCPWDREQTLKTLRPYAVEEVYEVIDAIDRDHVDDHREELGDLLLQVVFQAQVRTEEGLFDFHDVARAIVDKLVRRHPHVFADTQADDADTVVANWNAIKEQEKAGREEPASKLAGVPVQLPALLKAHEYQKKAAKTGFDWESVDDVFDKLHEELGELKEAVKSGDRDHCGEELGDVLFVLANVGRHIGVQAEQSLQDACTKFQRRFDAMEKLVQADGHELDELTLEQMDERWDRAKKNEKNA